MKNSSSSSPLTSLTPLPYQTLTLILAPILSHLSFSSSSNLTSTLPMDSGLDFADVFGGPPRRSSISDSLRRSPADSLGSGYWRGSGYGYGSRSGSGLGEKPVFGEISSPARRRHLKDDFFSDIFQSSESACSSPRKAERDSFNSPSSSSRILSPTRPLPPIRSEVVDGRSSLPTQLSPSMKLVKGVDHALNSSYKDDDGASDTLPFSPATIKSSYPTQTINAQDDLKTDGHVSYRQSPLSRQFFDTLDQSSEFMDSTGVSIKNHSQKDPTTLESYVSKGQFHFSIYKWAGKGVTLIMPSKSNLQHDSRFKILPEVVVQEVDVILHEDNTSTLTSAYKSLSENISIEGKDDSDLTTAKHLPAEFEAKSLHSKEIEKSDMRYSNDEEAPVTVPEVQKHELKVLRRLFDGDLDKQQNEEIIRQVEGKEDLSTGLQGVYENINVKQQSSRQNKRNSVKVSSPTMRDAPVPQEEKMLGSRVKGKVKDFINKFNQELSPKRKGTFNRSSEKSRGKDEGKVPDQVFISTNREDERVKHNSRSYDSTLPGTSVPIINLEKAEKENTDMSFAVHMLDDDLSERSDPLRQFSDSTPDILDASVCDIEESHFEDLEGYLVEPLYHDQNKDEHSDSHQDQIKIINDKVGQWSKGKDGNIRSLLSTLQYVLWPESGWKPVPLVDIIEGSSVKRAYQKALLSLHPDKLQQKGASVHQKYTAEKVFDILQEAWDHFNQMTQI